MHDYSNDPHVKKKADAARAFLKQSAPKSSGRKK